MNDLNPSVEVSFSPLLYSNKLTSHNFITVVVDILRATTSICAAFDHGVQRIIPVSGLDEAKKMKAQGYMVACERNGQVMEFADLGNSASDFLSQDLTGRTIVFSTTNGTKTINLSRDADQVLIGAFVNIDALIRYMVDSGKNVVIHCAAWKGLFNLEDATFAGALSKDLLKHGYSTVCDSVLAASGMWEDAKKDLKTYLSHSSHRNRLKHLVSDEDFDYTVQLGVTEVVPGLDGDALKLM